MKKMIFIFIILSILSVNTSKNLREVPNLLSTIKETPQTLFEYTKKIGNKKYLIGDPSKYLKSSDLTIANNNLFQIYNRKNIKTFIYLVDDIHSIYSSLSSFLSEIARTIGYTFDGDEEAKSYLFILVMINSLKYDYRLGINVKKTISSNNLKVIIQNNLQYLKEKNYINFIEKLTDDLYNGMTTQVNLKGMSTGFIVGIIIGFIILIFILCCIISCLCGTTDGGYTTYSGGNVYVGGGGGGSLNINIHSSGGGGGWNTGSSGGGGGWDTGASGGGGGWDTGASGGGGGWDSGASGGGGGWGGGDSGGGGGWDAGGDSGGDGGW